MIDLLAVVSLLLSANGQAATPEEDPRPLVQTIDARRVGECVGNLAGFRNVRLRCVAGADGALEQCEVLSTNRAVLRYSRIFRCMAANTRVTYPDGTPAVGRSVTFRVHGSSIFSSTDPR